MYGCVCKFNSQESRQSERERDSKERERETSTPLKSIAVLFKQSTKFRSEGELKMSDEKKEVSASKTFHFLCVLRKEFETSCTFIFF